MIFRTAKFSCVFFTQEGADFENARCFGGNFPLPRCKLLDPSEKSINKTYICKNITNIYINKTIICTNITFIYTFLRSVADSSLGFDGFFTEEEGFFWSAEG